MCVLLYVYAVSSPPRFDNRYMSAMMTNMTRKIVMYGGMEESGFFLESADAHALSSFVMPSHVRAQSSLRYFETSHLYFDFTQLVRSAPPLSLDPSRLHLPKLCGFVQCLPVPVASSQ